MAEAPHCVHLEPGKGRNGFFPVMTDIPADGALDQKGEASPREEGSARQHPASQTRLF
ncbi:MAG: hypothetical protein AAGF59_07880 [Pseudomonadota bacterium]